MSVRSLSVGTIVLAAASSAAPFARACYLHGDPTQFFPCCATDVPLRAATPLAAPPDLSAPFASRNMQLMSNIPLAQMGGGEGSSLYGWVDPDTKHEYAIMGRSNGTAFVDISDPTNPRYVANLPLAAGSVATSWREPKVLGNYAYIGVDRTSAPMQVLDLTKLRDYAGTTMTLSPDSNFTDVTKIHTIAVNKDSGYLYACGTDKFSGGLEIIDARNPAHPVPAGGFSGDGYTHETQVVTYHGPDAAYRGHEIAFNCNAKSGTVVDTFSIVDVANKSSIKRLASKTYSGAQWIHQGWLTEDHRYFFQNDEYDEYDGLTGGHTRTHLWDVSDLDNPVYKGHFDHAGTAVDHNLYVKGGYVYETNYTAGLRVLKIGNLASSDSSQWLNEVAYFDTYQADDNPTFNGAWNNYPYFPSGNIAISDINGGLFVVRPTLASLLPNTQDPPRISLDPTLTTTLVPEPASAMWMGIALIAARSSTRRARA